jgi:AcrR family transcriptional regulator
MSPASRVSPSGKPPSKEQGLAAVTMSKIAAETGIGRATLYKYFPDVETILMAWHERQVAGHLQQLTVIRDQAGDPAQQLQAMLEAYADRTHERPHSTELSALLHRGPHVDQAHRQLSALFEDLLSKAAQAGQIRGDVPATELASYCLNALAAASRVAGFEPAAYSSRAPALHPRTEEGDRRRPRPAGPARTQAQQGKGILAGRRETIGHGVAAMPLKDGVLPGRSGAKGTRTPDPLLANRRDRSTSGC